MNLTLGNDNFIIPDSWDQLDRAQMLRLADLSQKQLPPAQFKLHLLLAILGMHAGNNMHAYSHTQESPAATSKISEPC